MEGKGYEDSTGAKKAYSKCRLNLHKNMNEYSSMNEYLDGQSNLDGGYSLKQRHDSQIFINILKEEWEKYDLMSYSHIVARSSMFGGTFQF